MHELYTYFGWKQFALADQTKIGYMVRPRGFMAIDGDRVSLFINIYPITLYGFVSGIHMSMKKMTTGMLYTMKELQPTVDYMLHCVMDGGKDVSAAVPHVPLGVMLMGQSTLSYLTIIR